METILFLLIIGLLIFIAVRVSDIYTIFSKKNTPESSEEITRTEEPLDDEDYLAAKDFVIETKKASRSALQTAFRWGYNKSARIMNDLELFGVVGSEKPNQHYRTVLINKPKK